MTVPSVAERCAPSRVAREVPATLYRVAVRLTILGGGGFRVPLVYGAEALDITRAFINEYNSKNPATASVTPPQ